MPDGAMKIGDIMALTEYAVMILMYLIMGIMVFMIFPRAQSCANRVNEVLAVNTDTDVTPRKPQAAPCESQAGISQRYLPI